MGGALLLRAADSLWPLEGAGAGPSVRRARVLSAGLRRFPDRREVGAPRGDPALPGWGCLFAVRRPGVAGHGDPLPGSAPLESECRQLPAPPRGPNPAPLLPPRGQSAVPAQHLPADGARESGVSRSPASPSLLSGLRFRPFACPGTTGTLDFCLDSPEPSGSSCSLRGAGYGASWLFPPPACGPPPPLVTPAGALPGHRAPALHFGSVTKLGLRLNSELPSWYQAAPPPSSPHPAPAPAFWRPSWARAALLPRDPLAHPPSSKEWPARETAPVPCPPASPSAAEGQWAGCQPREQAQLPRCWRGIPGGLRGERSGH